MVQYNACLRIDMHIVLTLGARFRIIYNFQSALFYGAPPHKILTKAKNVKVHVPIVYRVAWVTSRHT